MPASCANAFAPTIALLTWTAIPVMPVRQAAGRNDPICADVGVDTAELLAARGQRHHDLFERGVSGSLADAVHRHFDLTRACRDRGQRVRRRHAEIVVAVDRDDDIVDSLRHAPGDR